MNDELERIRKEVVVAKIGYDSDICLEKILIQKKHVRTAGVPNNSRC